MKRFSLILLGALAILMAGCSKSDPQPPDENAWIYDLSLPVPIQFGAGFTPDLVTKTGYESLSDFNINTRFRVFGVDTDYAKYPNWEKDAEGNIPDGVILDHVPARFNNNKIEFVSGGTTPVKYYYPIESVCNYTFYAYHLLPNSAASPNDVGLINGANIVFKKDIEGELGGYYATDVQFGKLDLLWAKTEVSPQMEADVGKDGFNAAYCRAVRGSTESKVRDNQGKYMPNFAFEHITAAVEFYAVQGSEGDYSTVKVKKIRVLDAVPSATLCIAHQNPDEEKKWSDKAEPKEMSMTGIPAEGVTPGEGEGNVVGTGLFLCPQQTFEIEIDFESLDFNGGAKTYTLKRTVEADGGFQAGHKYVFKIVLNPSEGIDITISPTEFTAGKIVDDDNIFDEEDIQ